MRNSSKKYICQSNTITQRSSSQIRIYPEKIVLEEGSFISNSLNQITSIQIEGDKKQEIRFQNLSKRIEEFLESKKATITMSLVTLFALFADDIKSLGFTKSSDDIFSSLVVISLIFFSFELVLSFIYKVNYKWSFYFWLDLVATLSLVTDIGWIWTQLIGVSNSSSSGKQLQNAAKASRAGTRTSRILRIIRLIRLIRLVKLYKNAQIALKNEEDEESMQEELQTITSESKVGKKLSEVTMKRVILIVLTMLTILPLFENEFYFNPLTSWEFGVIQMDNFLNDQDNWVRVMEAFIEYHKNDKRPLVYLNWINTTGTFDWSHGVDYNDLRYTEIYYVSYKDFIAIFDIRYDSKLTSLLNIFKTLFICIVLTLGALYFTKDAEDLVIKPIEKIIERVKKIAKNPMAASEIKSIQDQLLELTPKRTCFCFKSSKIEQKADYETKIIENTITKIGVLLALGFGEAGSAIIGSNVEKHTEMDSVLVGTKVVGIFGFCDIINFTDTTEELQEGVMMFVNEIAQIIHGVVDKYFGAANKNIGDAFLLVWKFSPDEFYFSDDIFFRSAESKRAFYIPDLALLSFLKVFAKINKDPVMLKYRSMQKLTQRMPGYEVKMGFGLHLGWAIEGAIGSYFKVDASYLSPHVNIASSLEGLTKLYGVPILLSGNLFDVFSLSVQRYCRKVDVIRLKGSQSAITLYTCDVDPSQLSQGKSSTRKKENYRKKRKQLKNRLETRQVESAWLFEKSNEFKTMRKGLSKEFLQTFENAVNHYLEGEWLQSKTILDEILCSHPQDGPSHALLSYMKEYSFSCPDIWESCRYIS